MRNVYTDDLTWFNAARKTKPQTFSSTVSDVRQLDSKGPQNCDFCAWETLSAEDTFGRIEGKHCVSASNLFKYAAPSQGVILFKHHDPLELDLPRVADLLEVADGWFNAAAEAAAAQDLHPLLVWNALPRAGASQYHGHAQTMVSAVPFPMQLREKYACERFSGQYDGASYYDALVEAHAAVGLATRWAAVAEQDDSGSKATAYASICPLKDAEIVVHGASLRCPAFQALVFAALHALIGELGCQSFNAGFHNIPLASVRGSVSGGSVPVVARVVSRGRVGSAASDFGGLEVFGGASIGHTDPWRVKEALDAALGQLERGGSGTPILA